MRGGCTRRETRFRRRAPSTRRSPRCLRGEARTGSDRRPATPPDRRHCGTRPARRRAPARRGRIGACRPPVPDRDVHAEPAPAPSPPRHERTRWPPQREAASDRWRPPCRGSLTQLVARLADVRGGRRDNLEADDFPGWAWGADCCALSSSLSLQPAILADNDDRVGAGPEPGAPRCELCAGDADASFGCS
jgi:hypothetical protein